MTPNPIHILHLGDHGLAWVTLSGGRRHLQLETSGAISGEPIPALEQWAGQAGNLRETEIYLYDSRPKYFGFDVPLPTKAGKQAEGIIKMKIRQELGLGEDAVRWTYNTRPDPNAKGQTNFFTIVARKESLEDLAQWKEKAGLNNLWVGSDIGAVRALREAKFIASPAVVASCGVSEAALYHEAGDGQILKFKTPAETEGCSWAEGTSCAIIGQAPQEAGNSWPRIAGLPAPSEIRLENSKEMARLFEKHQEVLAKLDAVLLGGILESGFHRPDAGSLFGKLDYSSPFSQYVNRFGVRALSAAAGIAALVLAALLWGTHSQKQHAVASLSERADSLEADTQKLKTQEEVLQKIKADRLQNIPIIETVHKAAPPETTLQTMDIAENGTLAISATAKGENSATAFFKALSSSNKFEKVQLTNLKMDAGKKWVTFQLTGQIRGRKKR